MQAYSKLPREQNEVLKKEETQKQQEGTYVLFDLIMSQSLLLSHQTLLFYRLPLGEPRQVKWTNGCTSVLCFLNCPLKLKLSIPNTPNDCSS